MVGMLEYMDRKIGELSGGELQRVLLARALVREPDLLLLDEPTASVDPAFRGSFYRIIDELRGEMTTVIVSHDIGTWHGMWTVLPASTTGYSSMEPLKRPSNALMRPMDALWI